MLIRMIRMLLLTLTVCCLFSGESLSAGSFRSVLNFHAATLPKFASHRLPLHHSFRPSKEALVATAIIATGGVGVAATGWELLKLYAPRSGHQRSLPVKGVKAAQAKRSTDSLQSAWVR